VTRWNATGITTRALDAAEMHAACVTVCDVNPVGALDVFPVAANAGECVSRSSWWLVVGGEFPREQPPKYLICHYKNYLYLII